MNAKRLLSFVSRIDPKRITAGRELRALTKKALADKIGKSASAISQFESGRSGLDADTFAELIIALGLPPEFFLHRPESLQVDLSVCHFRANKSVIQTERRKAIQHALAVVDVYRALEQRGVIFPEPNVPIYDRSGYCHAEIEGLAESVRHDWSMGNGPIMDMASLLESHGVLVILLPSEIAKLHAFSFWAQDRPCVVVTETVSSSHMQFDYGHELAHIIMHMEEPAGAPESERAANHFSGAFLAPRSTFRLECPSRWNYFVFRELKQRWRLSMQALLYRGRQLNILSESSYRWGMIDISKRGERLAEADEFKKPLPILLTKALELLQGEFLLDELAEVIGYAVHDLEALLRTQHVSQKLIDSFKPSLPVKMEPVIRRLPSRSK